MLHTSMDFFVKHIAYLTFLILAQKEKFVKLFCKKYLFFLFLHVIMNVNRTKRVFYNSVDTETPTANT